MIRSKIVKKVTSYFFLGLLTIDIFIPHQVFALTSGPSQPEAKQFQPAGATDMVDLFTGDFKYNIPLLDIDGYPINLNYQTNNGMEDEASWVGYGWNLNAGSIDRQLRGIPDDANGDDVVTESYVKPKVTIGGKVSVKGELAGLSKGLAKVSGSIGIGVFSDNYTGIGAETSLNGGVSVGVGSETGLGVGANIGVNSNTQSGVDLSGGVSLAMGLKAADGKITGVGSSANLGYNTREGMKGLTLSTSFQVVGTPHPFTESSFNFNTPPFYPKANMSFRSRNNTYSADVGPAAFLFYAGAGIAGYKTQREIRNPVQTNNAYGFMYAEKAKERPDAMMDFMREKDNPVIPSLRKLAVPVVTPDIFNYSSQAGGGQLQLFRSASGVFADNSTKDENVNTSIGAEAGFGAYFHGGASLHKQDITSTSGKWKNNNAFLKEGDFPAIANQTEEQVYFKQIGEKSLENKDFALLVKDEAPVNIPVSKKSAISGLRVANRPTYTSAPAPYKKNGRQVRQSPVMYLTAEQAEDASLQKAVTSYGFMDSLFTPQLCTKTVDRTITRVSEAEGRRKHHLSELMVTGADGKRLVYGLPVYNQKQVEYSFATIANPDQNNMVDISYDTRGKLLTGTIIRIITFLNKRSRHMQRRLCSRQFSVPIM
ncbi:hypothetical protein MKQ68_10835 [Chitinophaga horti]|uniref:YD repeat-containing protein n=1 Tax=Chitinophaga horti TaxID=2920382 RepID=A0ABY6J8E3_9BACT|nr:hypothetical protein [Chitinophaga horti]UYQ95596.1 hypothetical protein MKQ68_10835 [Chitinophaga horti]